MKKKLTKTSKRKPTYTEDDFLDDLWETMKSQERINPSLKILHQIVDGSVKLVGLTGGIACGKSLVTQFFLEKKIPVIDADQVARDIVQPKKKAYQEIIKHFTKSVLISAGKDKGLIDRAALGKIVFENPEKRLLLEKITHPEIRKEISKQIGKQKKLGQKLIILDAALLFESSLDSLMSQVIVVSVDPDTQIKRLMERDKISEKLAMQKIQSQMSLREKAQRATFVIDNSGSRENTKAQFEDIFYQLTASLHLHHK